MTSNGVLETETVDDWDWEYIKWVLDYDWIGPKPTPVLFECLFSIACAHEAFYP